MTQLQRRWYDNDKKITATFDLIEKLDNANKQVLSNNLIEIIKQIKELHKEESEPDLSLGLERVLGLYKQMSNSRRWYDTNKEISYAIKALFTLPREDFLNIVEGLYVSLNK